MILILFSLLTSVSMADTNLVTCPEWRSKQKIYVDHSKKAEILKPEAPAGFIHLYRAIASILGSKRMTGELNDALEKSGYADLFDVLMSMNSRGGFPDDFIDAIKRFHNSKAFNMENETYVIDVNNQEMLAKFRRSYCK
ncbi:MAG: hypothetical protein HUU57_12930 [Bdellovibrio sp.]|nr:hypothetical protein [Bdellovibrio sp.]